MSELLEKRLEAVSNEAACVSDAIRYRYLRSAEGSFFVTFIAPNIGRGKHFDKALDKHMARNAIKGKSDAPPKQGKPDTEAEREKNNYTFG